MSVVAYHATTIEGARGILESGVFRQGCYFAYDAETALRFAGPVLFVATFDEAGFRNLDAGGGAPWQFWLRDDLPIGDVLISRHWSHGEAWTSDPAAVASSEGDAPHFVIPPTIPPARG